MHVTTQGIVLREVNYKESDKILTVLTQDLGKLTVSARASRKKGGGISAAAQMLVWSEMTLYEYRQRWGLKEAVTNREFRGVREDLDKFALASYFAEVTELLTPEQFPESSTRIRVYLTDGLTQTFDLKDTNGGFSIIFSSNRRPRYEE